MMQQHARIRNNIRTASFSSGWRFHEMFGEDAMVASKELDLVLTSRDKNAPGRKDPDVRCPYHASEGYIARLIARGHKVAICEQLEDPRFAEGSSKGRCPHHNAGHSHQLHARRIEEQFHMRRGDIRRCPAYVFAIYRPEKPI